MAEDMKVEIVTLGGFELRSGGVTVNESCNRAHKLWNLLEYLIAFRHRDIPTEELIEYLWPEDDSDNPLNALKNLVYRLRSVLANEGLPVAKELIIHRKGLYCWNNDIETLVDAEEMERLIKEASRENVSDQEKIEKYLKALSYYKGDFLPGSAYENWVVPLSAYYHSIYIKSVKEAAWLLREEGRHEDIEEICQSAVMVDSFDEEIHMLLIRALVAQNKQQKALEHYEYVTGFFYKELGVKPSEQMRECYREITKGVNHIETDLDVIKEGLTEAMSGEGAFVCDYEIFKNMYRLEARDASRSGRAIFIGLLTVTDREGKVPGKTLLNMAMDRLLAVIRESLRKSDVISRFSATQYILMLPSHTFENGQMVLDRIKKRFKESNARLPVKVNTKLQPLDPIS